MSRRRAALAAALLAACSPAEPAPETPEAVPIARLDGETITLEDVSAPIAFQVYRRRVDIHSLLRRETEALVDQRLLARSAAAQGVTPEALLRGEVDERVAPVTPADVEAYLAEHPREDTTDLDAVRARVRHYLEETRRIERRLAFLDQLRAQADYAFLLPAPEPPRTRLDVTGAPVRGAPDAPVTLVHFASLGSPQSARSARNLERLLDEYPDAVRWVHRHFLNDRDEVGLLAAQLAVRAQRAGRFWELHDALVAHRGLLDEAAVLRSAQAIGLDAAEIRSARTDPGVLEAVKRDIDAGNRAGARREPTVFVNGLYFSGLYAYPKLRALVDEELRRTEVVSTRPISD